MQKISKFLLFISIPIFLVNLSKQSSITKYCSGEVFFKNSSEKVVDIKIGSSKINATNKDIIVYKIPENQNHKLIKYEFNLDKIKEIQAQQNPNYTHNNEEYFKIKVLTKSNQTIDCIIKKDEQLIAKVKDTGWSVSYPFDQIKKVVIDTCIIKDDEEENK